MLEIRIEFPEFAKKISDFRADPWNGVKRLWRAYGRYGGPVKSAT